MGRSSRGFIARRSRLARVDASRMQCGSQSRMQPTARPHYRHPRIRHCLTVMQLSPSRQITSRRAVRILGAACDGERSKVRRSPPHTLRASARRLNGEQARRSWRNKKPAVAICRDGGSMLSPHIHRPGEGWGWMFQGVGTQTIKYSRAVRHSVRRRT